MTRSAALALACCAAAACTPLHRAELVPAAIGPGPIAARVVALSTDSDPAWYAAYELELRNPDATPVDIDLAAARLTIVAIVDDSVVTAAPIDAGVGPTPHVRRDVHARSAHVVLAAGEARTVWIAFGGPLDPRAREPRRQTLVLPGAGEMILVERTAAQPNNPRAYHWRERAIGELVRAGLELGSNHVGVAVPVDLGGTIQLGDVRLDLHFGHRLFDNTVNGTIERTGAFAVGPGVTYLLPHDTALYAESEYELLAPPHSGDVNALVVGAGIMGTLDHPRGTWRTPLAALRLGVVETWPSGGASSAALRISIEVTPAWVW